MNKRKLIGLMAMFIALGMLIMLFLRNRPGGYYYYRPVVVCRL